MSLGDLSRRQAHDDAGHGDKRDAALGLPVIRREHHVALACPDMRRYMLRLLRRALA